MSIKEILNDLMLEKRVTVEDVHRATGISRQAIHNLKSGTTKKPQLETLEKLADYFGVDIKIFVVEEKPGDIEAVKQRLDALAAAFEKELKNAGPSLNKISLNDYQREFIENKYLKGDGLLKVYARMKRASPEAREVILRLLWTLDEVMRRENYHNAGSGES